MTPDLKQLQELLAKLAVTQHAHTYASENADIYHAYDSGWQDCVKLMRPAIDALLTHRAALLASHEALSARVKELEGMLGGVESETIMRFRKMLDREGIHGYYSAMQREFNDE